MSLFRHALQELTNAGCWCLWSLITRNHSVKTLYNPVWHLHLMFADWCFYNGEPTIPLWGFPHSPDPGLNSNTLYFQAERLKTTREREERMVLSAWYEMGMHVHKKGLEERLSPQVGTLYCSPTQPTINIHLKCIFLSIKINYKFQKRNLSWIMITYNR